MDDDADRPNAVVQEGERWIVTSDLPTTGVTHWYAAFTGGFECVVPSETILIVANDPPHGATAVYCRPEDYEEMQRRLVPSEQLERSKYAGYSLVIYLANFGQFLTRL